MVAVHSQSNLLEVVTATHATRGFPSRLNRRKQESHQNANDGDDDQQFNEREC
jgi:hypothetical protein